MTMISERSGKCPAHWLTKRSVASGLLQIVLTALAATLGAFFILDDPIFNGLAVSLIFGILASTLLTLVIIPVLYYASEHKNTADTS
jgi:multidrug efflux pump subunit AcrB